MDNIDDQLRMAYYLGYVRAATSVNRADMVADTQSAMFKILRDEDLLLKNKKEEPK